MTDTTRLFQLAQLAEASYANLILGSNLENELKNSNFGMSFSPTQATEFAKNWQVVHHQPNTTNGYSGTLFKYIGNDPNSGFTNGEFVFSLRGTEPLPLDEDLYEDIDGIVNNGLAFRQIVDMYNHWQQLSAGAGQGYQVAKLVEVNSTGMPLDSFIVDADILGDPKYTVQFESSLTYYSSGDTRQLGVSGFLQTGGLTVTGHSLGGHLASAFTRLFPNQAEALTINGAGYPTGSTQGISGYSLFNIENLFSLLGGASEFGDIQNVFGEAMPEVVTMDEEIGLLQPGEHDGIYIEQPNPLGNTLGHGTSQITDSLAVYDLFIRMDASLQSTGFNLVLEELKPIFNNAGNQDKYTLEIITSALQRMLGQDVARADRTEFADREALHVALKTVRDALASMAGTLSVHVLDHTVSPETLVQNAQTDIAWRYALMELNPFVISGFDYKDHNKKGELNLYNPETGSGNLSETYLNDRAAMLTWKLKFDAGERDDNDLIGNTNPLEDDKAYNDDWDTSTVDGNWDYVDMGVTIDGTPLMLAIDGTGITTFDHQIIFGSKDNDSFNGSGDVDHLYGMAGNDTINGGDGDDWIEGGLNNDTLMGGDDDDELFGGNNDDTLYGDDNEVADMTYGGNDILHGGDGVDVLFGEGGVDTLYGDAGNDRLYGEKGNDILYGGADHDILSGGDGNDTLYGGLGQDIYAFNSGIFSGEGTDTVIDEDGWGQIYFISKYLTGASNFRGNNLWIDTSGSGGPGTMYYRWSGNSGDALTINDYYGQTKVVIQNFSNNKLGITLGSGTFANNITGTNADDYLWGNGNNNVIDGGLGADSMIGGAGNDTYVVDNAGDRISEGTNAGTDTVKSSVSFTMTSNLENIELTGTANNFAVGNGLNNILNGNAGNNILNGGAGVDIAYGGLGDDIYSIDSTQDQTVELANAGNDTVQIFYNNTAATAQELFAGVGGFANIENISIGGTGLFNMIGDANDNYFIGNAASNVMYGNLGADTLSGGAGADVLHGGVGGDTYHFNASSGGDLIEDQGGDGEDVVRFSTQVTSAEVSVSRSGSDLLFAYGANLVTVRNHYSDTSAAIESVLFMGNGEIWDTQTLAEKTNYAPVITSVADTLQVQEDVAFSVVLADDWFSDEDSVLGDTLSYRLTLADGSPPPDWMQFDAATRTLSGLASNAEVGSLDLNITATDRFGASATQTFAIEVANTNDAPVLETPLIDSSTDEQLAWEYVIPASTFTDVDLLDTLIYNVQLADGNPLPAWMQFDQSTGRLYGFAEIGEYTLKVTATDSHGAIAEDIFTVSVLPVANLITGTALNDTLKGTAQDDRIIGGEGNDTISGEGGNDTLIGGAGNDVLTDVAGTTNVDAGDGDDVVKLYNGSNHQINMGAGNDTTRLYNMNGSSVLVDLGDGTNVLTNGMYYPTSSTPHRDVGGTANINVTSGIGNDTMILGTGNHTVNSGDGADNINFGNGLTTVDAGEGNNIISGGTGHHNVTTGTGDDAVTLLGGNQTVIAGTGDNIIKLYEAGTRQLTVGDGADTVRLYNMNASIVNVILGDGNNVLTNGMYYSTSSTPHRDVGGTANINVTSGISNDTMVLGTGNHTVNSGDGADNISFANGLTIVDAGEGNNIISGGTGNHTVNTGSGNDAITLLGGNQVVIAGEGINTIKLYEAGTRQVSLGDGADTVRLYNMGGSNVNVTLGDGANILTNGMYYSTSSTPHRDVGGAANINVTSGVGNDNMVLANGHHTVNSGAGNDSISFGDGLTVVNAGEGINTISGGAGNHTITSGNDKDTITLGAGTQNINAGDGDNVIRLYEAGGREVLVGLGADTVRLYNMGGSTVNVTLGDGANILTNGMYYSTSSTPHRDVGGTANINVTSGIGNDTMVLGTGNHMVLSGDGADNISFANGLTTVDAGEGNNILSGGTGNHNVTSGTGNDAITLLGGNQTVVAGAGDNIIKLYEAGTRQLTVGDGADTVRLYNMAGSIVNVILGDGNNVLTNGMYYSTSSTPHRDVGGVANINVTSGIGNDTMVLATGNHTVNSGDGADNISFGNGITIVDAGEGNNIISGATGNFTVNTGSGNDAITLLGGNQVVTTGEGINTIKLYEAGERVITTGAGADLVRLYNINGSNISASLGEGNNTLTNGMYYPTSSTPHRDLGGSANIFVESQSGLDNLILANGNHTVNSGGGADNISFGDGKSIIQSGDGADTVTSGAGSSLFIGGAGNDTLTTGTGFDVMSFNKGDGQDLIYASTAADNTISLGGTFAYDELSLSKSANNLILKVGASDQITLKDWYLGTTNKSVANLQVIAEAVANFELGGADALRNNKVETFNFASLVAQFDADVAANATNATNWQLTDARLTAHLQSGSDTEAIGGDLAYQYGRNSNLTGMGLNHTQGIMGNANFGQTAQAINDPNVWQSEAVKLA